MTMEDYEEEVDVFKVLSHPLRREILKLIAKRGAASYKDLIQIVPKPGALYHHLRLLGDLIYQDEEKMYKLTPKGQHVYDFLVSEFFVPEDRFIHKILTPRSLFEKIEGKFALLIVLVFLLSNIVWIYSSDLLPIFILISPAKHQGYIGYICATLNWAGSSFLLLSIVRVLYKRRIQYTEVLTKITPAFILVNIYPLIIIGQKFIVVSILYVLIQLFSLLFSISAISVVARLPLRSSLVVVIILHYASLIIVTAIIIMSQQMF